MADFRNAIVAYPFAADLATITVPVVCSYGSRSPNNIVGRGQFGGRLGLRLDVVPVQLASA